MSVRMDERDLDLLLAAWFDEGPATAADFVVERALERVPNVRRRGGGWWPRFPLILRTHGPLLATLAVLLVLGTALLVALASIERPVIPAPSQPPTATSSPSTAPSPTATPRPAVSGGSFEISTPYGSEPPSNWSDFHVLVDRPTDGLPGYTFETMNKWVSIYLDPAADYLGTWDTTREDLIVYIFYAKPAASGDARGNFESKLGECVVTFDTFTATVAQGSLDCADIPGTYWRGRDPTPVEGFAQLSGTFAFDPSAVPASREELEG